MTLREHKMFDYLIECSVLAQSQGYELNKEVEDFIFNEMPYYVDFIQKDSLEQESFKKDKRDSK